MFRKCVFAAALLLGAWVLALMAQQGEKAPVPTELPKDWREWVHVKTGVIYSEKHPLFEAFGGMHHIYANKIAAEAYKKGEKKFPDGSIIVFVLYEAKDEGGMFVAGEKKVVAVMVKDSKRYEKTGGWGWQAWDAKGKALVTDPVEQCFTCHKPMRENDYVFSKWTP
jgi:hypothetical protein